MRVIIKKKQMCKKYYILNPTHVVVKKVNF